ncbi:MAG: hypothetical protein IGR76_10565 [Synechococcales cyanobacterium T60_A2020_003]|nr:hypothetical protein [Synechococcales cyanobacterium T60_A2020_003]
MANAVTKTNLVTVEIAEGVFARTSIAPENHSALRAGFGGYTANPRWNATKFLAWKTGRQWRAAVANHEMMVRSSDSMLVPVVPSDAAVEEEPSSRPKLRVAFA